MRRHYTLVVGTMQMNTSTFCAGQGQGLPQWPPLDYEVPCTSPEL